MPSLLQPREQAQWNFLTGLLTGGIGAPGDIGQAAQDTGIGLLNARMQSLDPTGRMRAMSGMHAPLQGPQVPYGSAPLQARLGGDPSAPESLLGAVGAPEVTDIAKGAGLLAKMGTDLAPGGLLAQALFHGTPHKFDKFELEKIGTGEGAQAYGHGLYFAESPGVAKSYQSDLSRTVKFDGKEIDVNSLSMNDPRRQAISSLSGRESIDDAIKGLRNWADAVEDGSTHRAAADWLEQNKDRISHGGHLYEVDIPDETIGKMLDWDKPLSEQPENMKAAFKAAYGDVRPVRLNDGRYAVTRVGADGSGRVQYAINEATPEDALKAWESSLDDMTGGQAYFEVAGGMSNTPGSNQERASQILNEAGIPGIRYYDNQSRGRVLTIEPHIFNNGQKGFLINGPKGDKFFDTRKEAEAFIKKINPDNTGTRNIVVFNPDDITKVKRDGELVYKTGKGLLGK